jgi:clan AA aspartic protease
MGLTTVNIKVKNPQNPSKSYEGDFLVDSGAQFTVLPEPVWKSLNLAPQREQDFSLADGTVVNRKIGSAFVEFQGVETATPVVLGHKSDSFLLGVITLEALGLTLDPFSRQLYKAKLML